MTLWIVDTSPLIFLAKLNSLDLLKRGADQIVAPPAVFREIGEYPDAANREIEDAARSWLGVREVADRQVVDVLMADLDTGESEALALALETKAERVEGLPTVSALFRSGLWASCLRQSCEVRSRASEKRSIASSGPVFE